MRHILGEERLSGRVDPALFESLPVLLQQSPHVLGQNLAQFDPVLVVTVNVPDETLDRSPVFVQG